MKIDVKVFVRVNGNQMATASVNLDDAFAVTGIKVMQGSKGLFVSMPSYKTSNGFRDLCFPINKEFREELHNAVLSAYRQQIQQLSGNAQKVQDEPEQFPDAPDYDEAPDENFDGAEYSSAPKMGM